MKMYICGTTKVFESLGKDWGGTFGITIPRGCTSLWTTERHMKFIVARQQHRGAAPITPAKDYSPFANPGLVRGRDFVPRTPAKGLAPLQTPVFFLPESAGNKEIVKLTKSTGKIV